MLVELSSCTILNGTHVVRFRLTHILSAIAEPNSIICVGFVEANIMYVDTVFDDPLVPTKAEEEAAVAAAAAAAAAAERPSSPPEEEVLECCSFLKGKLWRETGKMIGTDGNG